jgi:hypothetical protein
MKTLAYRGSAVVIILFVWASLCAAQQMDRLVDWQPEVAPTSNGTLAPLEIVGIMVNDTPVKMGKPFAADEDWLDKLTFRIRNISDKTISAFWFNVALPETDLPNGGYAGIGILFDAKKSSDQGKRILPGGELDIPLAVPFLNALRHSPHRLPGTTQWTRLNIHSWFVVFDDGSNARGTSLKKP